jgi:hypothetical protein
LIFSNWRFSPVVPTVCRLERQRCQKTVEFCCPGNFCKYALYSISGQGISGYGSPGHKATRSNSYLGGKPPDRGSNTFLPAAIFEFNVSKVVEVTFENECTLNGQIEIGQHPEGTFILYK